MLQLPARTFRAWQDTLSLVPRLVHLIGDAEDLIGEIRAVTRDAHTTGQQAQQAVLEVQSTRRHVDTATDQAQSTTDAAAKRAQAQRLTGQIQGWLHQFTPALTTLIPLTRQLTDTVTAVDLTALQVWRSEHWVARLTRFVPMPPPVPG